MNYYVIYSSQLHTYIHIYIHGLVRKSECKTYQISKLSCFAHKSITCSLGKDANPAKRGLVVFESVDNLKDSHDS